MRVQKSGRRSLIEGLKQTWPLRGEAAVEAAKRPLSSMTPTIVNKDGEVIYKVVNGLGEARDDDEYKAALASVGAI